MIVRFRGKDGTYRVTADPAETFAATVERVEKELPPHSAVRVSLGPTGGAHERSADWDRALSDLGIKHGDMFFLEYAGPEETGVPAAGLSAPAAAPPVARVDNVLAGRDGKIDRGRSAMCTHGAKGMCEYCQPLDPYDEEYRLDRGIKHLSYHAYVRKLQDESGRQKVLSEPIYSVRPCQAGHAAWPAGICSKCQPSAITLQQQRFRMVDHVEFADPSIINRFIEYWRQSNTQRVGVMIGEYLPHDQVPLGIKAVVHAIYEPPQDDVSDGITFETLLSDASFKAAGALGYEPVGLIFSDLQDAGKGDGTVVVKRHPRSYFLSSLEILFAAQLQLRFPSASPVCDTGTYSSKFVTCVVSGNMEGEIDVACYQVSVQAESMARADLIIPSTNPSVMRVKEATKTRYVPEVFYKHYNEYKLAVQEDAKPAFPDDYLLVSLSHGFPESPVPHVAHDFPIENRPNIRSQTAAQVVEQLQLTTGFATDKLADFHLLVYLFSLEVLKKDEELLLGRLIAAERADTHGDEVLGLATQLAHSEGFQTLRLLGA